MMPPMGGIATPSVERNSVKCSMTPIAESTVPTMPRPTVTTPRCSRLPKTTWKKLTMPSEEPYRFQSLIFAVDRMTTIAPTAPEVESTMWVTSLLLTRWPRSTPIMPTMYSERIMEEALCTKTCEPFLL